MFMRFLDKTTKRKVALFQLLEHASSLTVTKETLMDKLEISDFLLTKTIEELNEDFYEFGLDEKFQIVTDGFSVTLNETGMASSETLIDNYLLNSLNFELIEECFFNRFESVNDFAIDHYVSHTFVYKELKQLKCYLNELDIDISKDFHLVGNEHAVREFVMLVFLKLDNHRKSIFSPKLIKLIETFDKLFDDVLVREQSLHAKRKKFIYLGIVFSRIEQGFFIQECTDDFFGSKEFTPLLDKIYTWLYESMPIEKEAVIKKEAQEILQFLFAESWLEVEDLFIIQQHPFISQLNQLYLQSVQERFPVVTKYLEEFSNELTQIHCQLLTFPLSISFQYSKADVAYFLETYPEYFLFCRDFLQKNHQRSILWDGKEYLFYNYLLMMIMILPLKEVLPSIKICVDFSFGRTYNRMIQKNIEKMSEFNVHFQAEPDSQTNLILSDRKLVNQYNIDHVIWIAPPRPIDWANFTKKVLKIRRKIK